jgi:secondary thiamine-phosphate synthase enzyme
MTLVVKTDAKRQVIDIADLITAQLKGSGLANIFLKHTTAAITIADMDPGTDQDYLKALKSITPLESWDHPHDPSHFPDHLWSALIGPSISVPFKDGKLLLGSWQSLVLIELDGPRERQIELTTI